MPIRLSRPVTIGDWTFHGVDDWQAFCTDSKGNWFTFYTECSPMWLKLPATFIGECGYPDTDEGVLATAILEAQAGIKPDPVLPEHTNELKQLFLREVA